jgi:Ca2+-binding EF-hand superfamily protein
MTNSKSELDIFSKVESLLPKEKLQFLLQSFNQLDSNQDGLIALDEYLNFALGKEKGRLVRTFDLVDTDKDGHVEFEEFVAAIEPHFHILKKFHELDLDQNGLLSLEEALNIADQLVLPLSRTQVESIIHEVDRDGDGQITYYEYLGAIAHIGFQ